MEAIFFFEYVAHVMIAPGADSAAVSMICPFLAFWREEPEVVAEVGDVHAALHHELHRLGLGESELDLQLPRIHARGHVGMIEMILVDDLPLSET